MAYKNIYTFEKDPTIPSTLNVWNEGYNNPDDVFRSTMLTHMNKWTHYLFERNEIQKSKEIKIKCGDCQKKTTFTFNLGKMKSPKSVLCDNCKQSYKSKKSKRPYLKKLHKRLFEVNMILLKNVTTVMSEITTTYVENSKKDTK